MVSDLRALGHVELAVNLIEAAAAFDEASRLTRNECSAVARRKRRGERVRDRDPEALVRFTAARFAAGQHLSELARRASTLIRMSVNGSQVRWHAEIYFLCAEAASAYVFTPEGELPHLSFEDVDAVLD